MLSSFITGYNDLFKFLIQRPGIRFKPGYKQAGISQINIPILVVGIRAVITVPRTKQNTTKMIIL